MVDNVSNSGDSVNPPDPGFLSEGLRTVICGTISSYPPPIPKGDFPEGDAVLYYVNDNAQSNGDHEVHQSDCSYLPDPENRTYLGTFDSCAPAVRAAKEIYRQSNGCYWCSRPCNTG